MKNTFNFLNCILLIISFGCSQNSEELNNPNSFKFDIPSEKGLGFQKVETILNKNMIIAQDSIYKVLIPSGNTVNAVDAIGDPNLTIQQAYQYIKNKGAKATKKENIQALQFFKCIKDSSVPCMIKDSYIQFSAFSMNFGTQLATTSMVFTKLIANSYSSDEIKLFSLDDLRNADLDVLVYNHQDSLLINETTKIKFSHILNSGMDTENQFCLFNLPNKVSTSLRISNTPPSYNDTVYVAGFPFTTNDRSKLGAQDSTGIGVHFSHGFIDKVNQIYQYLGMDWAGLTDSKKLSLNMNVLAMRIDATPEMIGAPILNENGEVIGMLTSTTDNLNQKYSFAVKVN